MALRLLDQLQTACMKLVGDGKDPYLGCQTQGQIDERDACLNKLVTLRLLARVHDLGYTLTTAGRAALLPRALARGSFETPETGEENT